MNKYPLAIVYDISVANLWAYRINKEKALLQRIILSKRIDIINIVLAVYEKQHSKLSQRLKDIRQEIRLVTKGIPDQEGKNSPIGVSLLNESQLSSDSIAYRCKRSYRSLAQRLHPDKGGDKELFASIYAAYRRNDINYLNNLFVTIFKESDLNWQKTHGIEHWKSQEMRAIADEQVLRGLPLYKVVQFHMTGNHVEASIAIEKHMRVLELELTIELDYLFRK